MNAVPPALAPDLVDGLRRLKLSTMRQLAPELLVTAKTQRWAPKELLRTLIEAEIAARELLRACARVEVAAANCAIGRLDWQDGWHDGAAMTTYPMARGMAVAR